MAFKGEHRAILIANILIVVAISIFSSGFFPYKSLLPGLATFAETNIGTVAPKVFDRVIFMVIDALRSDFVYSKTSGFSFTQSLIRSGAALPFTAHASSPTVTMPRLKAMTTGSVPSFLDVILNIAESDTSSTLAYQDTWLAQIKAQGGQLVMYGDDTWIKLFPGVFDRCDGTTSFFVSDFTEVDHNVTRHVPRELSERDWSAFIMHFLGLDHIGHKAGPKSRHMMTKQREMDSIVALIYAAMEEQEHLQSTLFVLCGDHGMNDAGNHGGSSPGEISPALLFISPKFQTKTTPEDSPVEAFSDLQYYRTVEQVDITPTLAGLLGLPIPLNSLGVFIPEFLMMWDNDAHRIDILLRNAKQMLSAMKGTFPDLDVEAITPPHGCDKHVLRSAQDVMSSTASKYNTTRLYLGLFVAALAVLLSFFPAYGLGSKYSYAVTFLMLIIISYGGMMFASSYVEEEQQFWYWVVTAWTVYLHIKSLRPWHGSKDTRRWNQTGQKFAAEPDIARDFFPRHQNILWALIILTYFDTCMHLCLNSHSSNIWRSAAILTTIAAFFFKLVFVASDSPELLYESLLSPIQKSLEEMPLVPPARLSKAVNIPIFLMFRLQAIILDFLKMSAIEVTLTSLLSQNMTFFAFGGSNAISSVDLSNAYNGIGSYSVVLVGVLTFISNWAGPIWWASAARLLYSNPTFAERYGQRTLLTFHAATSLMSVMAACTMLRTHLFIWTVFSPKYLYTLAWTILNHMFINLPATANVSQVLNWQYAFHSVACR
ncbi:mannose-ethanolamine phosphotransferase LAS21 [Aspergillus fumigatus Af293]|uniref:GPI ethanolamine phosphate transferase 2 n=1 Tax=Aspergillus fumigatus (strain ATCC MYA-4609 / CBS 101355 / FGSC A1100 / Af293) TaxID=330879 RepID=GPI7_ASPFU|nr:transferase (Gpi7), putative [Aspergillus fumigatus Af293]Q4WDM5.1 RecName: Full=GPI ethanolamine phosphate transferase 2; AltName: Full=Glycosylphosphatidylinositol-anchor biosynthesis protein 7 [Aspergillus fumigatus Af293]ABD84045.1 phosphoethanolamine transferase 7 [Aspergillus fumigatus]EAL85513.1 transferase (Gpi7), putative [Aspergillus fumigatus Af293]